MQARYDELPAILARLGRPSVQGILFDLGVSSPQLDDPQRGFAYSYDAPLDMRMDTAGPLTAADVVNTYPADRIAAVLREYGEERFARRIADALVRERGREPLTTTLRLAEIVRDSIPAAARRTGGNPAKRTFQALRIEVNGGAGGAAGGPAGGAGRDRRRRPDRRAGLSLAGGPGREAGPGPARRPTPRRRACRCRCPSARPQFRLLTRGAERPGEAELAANPRAASARLRAAERVRAAA